MDKNIYEELVQYEKTFANAVYASFVRLTNNAVKADLARLHTAVFGNDGNIIGGCNRCVLNSLKNLGKAYFKEKERIEMEEKKAAEKAKNDIVGLEAEQITELVENKAVTKPKRKTSANKAQK